MTRRAAFGWDFQSKGNWGSKVGLCHGDKKRRAGCERARGRTQLPKDLPLCSSHFCTDAFEPSWRPKLLSGRISETSVLVCCVSKKKTQPKTGLPQTVKATKLTMCLRKGNVHPDRKHDWKHPDDLGFPFKTYLLLGKQNRPNLHTQDNTFSTIPSLSWDQGLWSEALHHPLIPAHHQSL